MNDPQFVLNIQDIGLDYQNLFKYMRDQRIMDALAVLLGINLNIVPGRLMLQLLQLLLLILLLLLLLMFIVVVVIVAHNYVYKNCVVIFQYCT